MKLNGNEPVVIIPAYEPPAAFVDYARKVSDFAAELVVVNDGSGEEYEGIFREIEAIENVKYISYGENHGKGYALKTAFKYCIENYGDDRILVCADCDGQHEVEDIEKVAACAFEHSSALVLGSRNFDLPNVPKRSRAGNTNIRRLFHLLYGLDVYDTQTGLRGFSVKLAKEYLTVHGNRFEFEMGVLIQSQKRGIPVLETPIKTVYPDNPEEHISHYKTVKDSARIVGTVVRNLNWYLLSSALSGVLDVVVFFLMSTFVLGQTSALNTLIATVTARVASSVLNFIINRKYVFAGKSRRSVFRYYTLWLCQLGASYALVFLLGNIAGLPLTPIKALGDIGLAFFSYQIQRLWVFKNDDKDEFYGPLVSFIRQLAMAFTRKSKKYRCDCFPPEQASVYVCRHLNMHGPITSIKWLKFHVHPMILSVFFDKKECYRQYADYTFTARVGKKKKKHNPKAYLASRAVPCVMKSLRAIPVHRGASASSVLTLRGAMACLKRNESVIVYPDIDYTATAERESELYEGFLMLGELYKRNCGKSLRFIPLYIDEQQRAIKECPAVTVDNFKEEHSAAYEYIKAAINGRQQPIK